MSLMLHCDSEETTRAMVEAIPTPSRTGRYNPVGYADALAILEDTVKAVLGLELLSETYGLNQKGNQLFAHFIFDADDTDGGLAVGLRQSLNKTLALGTVVGKGVFVCDNLLLCGELKVVRKNTTNVYRDYRTQLSAQLEDAMQHYKALNHELDAWKTTHISEREGYQLLGVAMGKARVLSAQQGSIALKDWETPRHSEFSERNAYNLYQCVTEGLKKGAPGRMAERHLAARAFMQNEVQHVEC